MRRDLQNRSPPATRNNFITAVGILAVLIVVVLASVMFGSSPSSTFTAEEQLLLGP